MKNVYIKIDMNTKDEYSGDLGALVRGYGTDARGDRACLYCAQRFQEGRIYPVDDGYLDADRAARRHVETVHGGPFRALASLGARSAGITEVQASVLELLHEGHDDAEIARRLGGKSTSTVRNHRFQLRKREAEARNFLALMILLDRAGRGAGRFVGYAQDMPGLDERAVVTEEEAARIETKHFRSAGIGGAMAEAPAIRTWPRQQKAKLVLLRRISSLFEPGRRYRESEVNDLLRPVWDDHVTIRRYLIEYRFLDRKPDGSEYWLR